MNLKDIPLPENWPILVRQAMIHASSLAHYCIIFTRSHSVNSSIERVRLKIKNDRLETKVSQLENQLRINQARFSRVPSKSRPHYTPPERMDILMHKAVCCWNLKQTGEAFNISPGAISSWLKRIEDDDFFKTQTPVNKYPDALKFLVQKFKVLVPAFGKKKIAAFFLRAGLHLSATSVGRFLKDLPSDSPEPIDDDASEKEEKIKRVTSRHPNRTWMIDLTAVPIGGFSCTWMLKSIRQSWPFCWWGAIIIDHFSRKVIGFAVFHEPPESKDVISLLNRVIRRLKRKPKYIISDKGTQFHPPQNAKDKENHPYRIWCRSKKIKPRYGAIGKYGSIAIIERFMRSLKGECTRRLILIPYDIDEMRQELRLYCTWYNQFRPHEYLKSKTPQEVYNHSPPLKELDFKHNSEMSELKLNISYLEGRKHLPILEIEEAA